MPRATERIELGGEVRDRRAAVNVSEQLWVASPGKQRVLDSTLSGNEACQPGRVDHNVGCGGATGEGPPAAEWVNVERWVDCLRIVDNGDKLGEVGRAASL